MGCLDEWKVVSLIQEPSYSDPLNVEWKIMRELGSRLESTAARETRFEGRVISLHHATHPEFTAQDDYQRATSLPCAAGNRCKIQGNTPGATPHKCGKGGEHTHGWDIQDREFANMMGQWWPVNLIVDSSQTNETPLLLGDIKRSGYGASDQDESELQPTTGQHPSKSRKNLRKFFGR